MSASFEPDVIRRPDGATVAYDVGGDGPPILFLHGLTSSRRSWDPVTELLTPTFTCVRIDFRGHGDSSKAADYGMVSLVGDVHAVAEEVGFGAPALVGNSLGAAAVAIYASVHEATAAVCVDEPLRFGDRAALIQAHAADLRADPIEAVLGIERELDLGPYEDVAVLERRVRAFPPEVVLGVWERALTASPDELTALSEAVLPQVTAPLLSLHGSLPPNRYESWLTNLVPTAEVEVWDGMGHLLHLVNPQRFAARVAEFLTRGRSEGSNGRQ